jgi:hypothetical protein
MSRGGLDKSVLSANTKKHNNPKRQDRISEAAAVSSACLRHVHLERINALHVQSDFAEVSAFRMIRLFLILGI